MRQFSWPFRFAKVCAEPKCRVGLFAEKSVSRTFVVPALVGRALRTGGTANCRQPILKLLFVGWLATSTLMANEPEFSSQDLEFFENDIRPLLVAHCLKCHGDDAKKIRGGLLLNSRASMLKGGESGPAVVPGNPAESLLIKAVHYDEFEMPPKGQLPPESISKLEQWIEKGAPDPRRSDGNSTNREIDIQEGRKFWAFQPRKHVQPPNVSNGADWIRTDIDRFVLQKLTSAGIAPNSDADRTVMIRRAYMALVGLAPTPEQIDGFVTDPRPFGTAFGSIVDKLLASPHFGERWGRHWLDVARFAESSGGGRSLMFKDAWRYRDYIVSTYNKDKPFDQFVREQLAGDLLPHDSGAQRSEQLTATGFLALGPINYEQQNKSLLRMEVVDEQVDTVGRAFLAMTLGCARCHDHKFDPIPTSDYYAIAGIFGSTKSLVDGNVSSHVTQRLPLPKAEQDVLDDYKRRLAELTKKAKRAKADVTRLGGKLHSDETASRKKSVPLDTLRGNVVDSIDGKVVGKWTHSTAIAKFVGEDYIHNEGSEPGSCRVVYAPRFAVGGKYEVRLAYSAGGNRASNVPVTVLHQDGQETVLINQSQTPPIDGLFVSLGTFRFEADNAASVTIGSKGADGIVIADAVQFLPADSSNDLSPPARTDVAVDDSNKAREFAIETTELAAAEARHKKIDEELKELKKDAPPPAPVVMSVEDAAETKDGHIHIRGSFDNLGPVVRRGYLSVACEPDSASADIAAGSSGRLELANWIASPDNPLTARVYVNRVWRQLFGRGLVATVDSFGSMGEEPSHPELLDHLAERFIADGWSTKRLIRRLMLSRVFQLSSTLNSHAVAIDDQNRLLWRANRRRLDAEVLRDAILQASGSLDLSPGGLTIRKLSAYDLGYEFKTVRRSVYVPTFRNSMMPFLEIFDVANPNLVTGDRNTTTLATQALFMMNSPFVIDESRKLAERLLAEKFADEADRVQAAYRRLLGRFPTPDEAQLAENYLSQFEPDDRNLDDRLEAWSSFCHGLFACVDFRYVE